MTREDDVSFEGGCTCGAVRYLMTAKPMFVHCCHCTWCQRETGSAFVLNAIVEAERVSVLNGKPKIVDTPTASGKGQKIFRCPQCEVALWSNYAGAGDTINFLRVGTLDEPGLIPPDIHIYTMSKQPWVVLPHDVPAVNGYYKLTDYWPEASIDRRRIAKGGRPRTSSA